MKTIHKYPLTGGTQIIQAPLLAKPLYVGLDPIGTPCVWALVDTSMPLAGMIVLLTGTGSPLPEGAAEIDDLDKKYVGTILQGLYVWHVFHVNPCTE